jgi:hypothetical protein
MVSSFAAISSIQGSQSEFGYDLKHPWFNKLSPFIHYRTNPVFMAPAHLTLSQLSKILLDSSVHFKARALPSTSAQSNDTLEYLMKQLESDQRVRE